MKIIVTTPQDHQEALEKYKCVLKESVEYHRLEYFSEDGEYIIRFHLPHKMGYMVGATDEPVNYNGED